LLGVLHFDKKLGGGTSKGRKSTQAQKKKLQNNANPPSSTSGARMGDKKSANLKEKKNETASTLLQRKLGSREKTTDEP